MQMPEITVENIVRALLGAVAFALAAVAAWYFYSWIWAVLSVVIALIATVSTACTAGYYASTKGYDCAVAGAARVMGFFSKKTAVN